MTVRNTHLKINSTLCGEPLRLETGRAATRFTETGEMTVDEHGLVHGGFLFGLADYAAMLAVNDPNVVLGSADIRFLAPVRVGDEVVAEAEIIESNGNKRTLKISACVADKEVLAGTLVAFVLDAHVLEP